MKDLRSYQWKYSYISDEDNLLEDLFIPGLSLSKEYWRACGYYSSSSLSDAAQGISALLQNNGSMKLLVCPELDQKDIDAIKAGYDRRQKIIEKMSRCPLDDDMPVDLLTSNRFEALRWLIEKERLEIKVAYLRDHTGLFHAKFGCFHDERGNIVATTGSSNESRNGKLSNLEKESLNLSWELGQGESEANKAKEDFLRIWNGESTKCEVLDFTDEANQFIIRPNITSTPGLKFDFKPEEEIGLNSRELQNKIGPKLRTYQRAVLNDWKRNKFRGIVSLATGCGKTFVALAGIEKLVDNSACENILVLCPFQNLVDQWGSEIKENLDIPVLKAMGAQESWNQRLPMLLNADVPVAVVATMATLKKSLRNYLPLFKDSLLICDEAHHIGSESNYELLPERGFPYRLGLTATPNRHNDPDGTERIFEWFGRQLSPTISVGEAIYDHRVLCEYLYHPVVVHMDDEECSVYEQHCDRIDQLFASGHVVGQSKLISTAINERTRFLSGLNSKQLATEGILSKPDFNSQQLLIYCGAGSSQDEPEQRIVDRTCQIANRQGRIATTYTSRDPQTIRRKKLNDFTSGLIDCLIAIGCLDEGVDVPSIDTAVIMSSSKNPKQFIQRRGRVLRKKGDKIAAIYDLVALPSQDLCASSDSVRRSLESELKRYIDFAISAKNRAEVESILQNICRTYNVDYPEAAP